MWGHDQEVIRREWDCTLEKDCNSFEMHKMTVRMDQLLCIAEATNSEVYTWESEAEAHGWTKALALSLKQYHAHYYRVYKKGTIRAMVGLQGLHSGNIFRCSNVSSSVVLKWVCLWCFKLGKNTEMIATHLQEVHYRLAIVCDLCKSFTSMSAWSVLECCSGCKAMHAKECTEQDGNKKVKRLHKKKSKAWEQEKHPNCLIRQHLGVQRDKVTPNSFCPMNTGGSTLQILLCFPDHVFWVGFHSMVQTFMLLFQPKCL